MIRPFHLAWVSAALLLALPLPALSQTATSGSRTCAPRDVVLDRLAEGYGETRKSIGLRSDDTLVEVFASEASGTWTITVTTPQGITCLIASGQAYERLDEALSGDDQDA